MGPWGWCGRPLSRTGQGTGLAASLGFSHPCFLQAAASSPHRPCGEAQWAPNVCGMP